MCTPNTFFADSPFYFDCSDYNGVDNVYPSIDNNYDQCFQDPAFRCEELSASTTYAINGLYNGITNCSSFCIGNNNICTFDIQNRCPSSYVIY